jgi:uncharacterized protein YciI
MKLNLSFLLLVTFSWLYGQSTPAKDSVNSNPNYYPTLAQELGADAYGMKSYFLVILKTGSNTTQDQEFISQSFRGHMENMNRLMEDQKLVVAGPFGKNDNNYRGIFILQGLENKAEVEDLLQTDPAIKNGLLDYDLYDWYGSAALPVYLKTADQIWTTKP